MAMCVPSMGLLVTSDGDSYMDAAYAGEKV